MKKQSILTIMTVLLVMSLLAGCSNGKTASTSTDGGDLPFVELKMIYPVNANSTRDQEMVTDEINKYLKEKINASVVLEALDSSTFYQKLPIMITAGENFDISWVNPTFLLQNVNKNAFMKLDDLLDSHGQDIKEILPPLLLDGVKVNGELFSLPVFKEYGIGTTYYFREDIVEELGLDVMNIKTLRDLEPLMDKVKQSYPDIAPFYVEGGSMDPFLPASLDEERMFDVAGLTDKICFNPEDGKFYNKLEMPSTLERNKIFSEWFAKGYINKDATTTNVNWSDAIKIEKSWFAGTSSKPGMEDSLSKTVGFNMIRGYGEETYVRTGSLMGSMNAISITSKNPERAMMLLNLLYSDKELLNLFNFGIEGKHYTKVNENVIKLPEGLTVAADTGYAPGIDWRIGNNYNLFIWDYEPADKWEQYKTFSEDAQTDPLLGFYFDTTNVKNELSTINNLQTSYDLPLKAGVFDVEEATEKYVQKLKEAGIDRVIEEVQNQYDSWKSGN